MLDEELLEVVASLLGAYLLAAVSHVMDGRWVKVGHWFAELLDGATVWLDDRMTEVEVLPVLEEDIVDDAEEDTQPGEGWYQ